MRRRNFVLASTGIAGSILAPASWAAIPCPPPEITVGGVSAASAICPAPTGNSSLGTLAASMSSGSWASFTMGGMSASLLDSGGGHSITEFSARGHWDSVHKKIQYWGAGHYESEKFITWDDATNQWTAGAAPNLSVPEHAYYHLAMNPATGDLYVRQFNSAVVKKKAYNGTSWTAIASHHNTAQQVAGAMEWFPGLNGGAGGLVFGDTLSLETWNPATNSWTMRNGNLSNVGPYHNWMVATTDALYFGGGNGSTVMYRMAANGTVTSAPNTPSTAAVASSIVMRHPDGRQLLMFGQGSSGPIHRFDGTSWVSHGTHQIGGASNLWFGIPISDYGIVLFVAQTGSASAPTVKVYKP